MTRGSESAQAEERLRPGQPQRRQLRGWRGRDRGAGAAERAHDDHAEAELLGERQQLALGLALARVERNLDRVDPPGAHDARELVEGAGRVVRRAEEADAAGVPLPLEPVEVLAPGDEVVHLLEVDPAREEAELVVQLGAALLDRAGPDLRRDERLVSPPGERAAEHALGAAVHRGGVDEPRSGVEGGADDGVRDLLLGVRQVEGRPGPEAHDGDLDAGAPEGSPLHTVCRHAPGEPTRRSRARRGPHRRAGLRRELPGRLGAGAALRAAAPARRVRLRPARRHARRRGARRPRGAARRARARAPGRAAHGDHAPPARDDRRARPRARALPPADRGQPDRPGTPPLRDLGGRPRVLHVLGRPGRPRRARHLRARRRPGARGA